MGSLLHPFLQVGELTVPSDGDYEPNMHLSLSDVAIDRLPSIVRTRIKQSKTDSFQHLCRVSVLLQYLHMLGTNPGPLFQYMDGRPLIRARFADEVRDALRKAGIDQSKYCTHSFRIGAATTAAAKRIKIIKT